MDAIRGRASFLGERALGHVDPGSRSMALIIAAICDRLSEARTIPVTMKKLINDVDDVLAESLDGFAAAHADIVSLGAERKFVRGGRSSRARWR